MEGIACAKCGEVKPIEKYYPSCAKAKDWRCKACFSAKNNAWRDKNRAQSNENERLRCQALPKAKRQARHQRQYLAHRRKILTRNREWAMRNPERLKSYQKEWARLNKERRRPSYIARKYGLTADRLSLLLDRQGNACAVCGSKENWGGRRLTIDHCHRTKAVRGLLCNNCNVAIGLINDNPDVAKKMAEYLRTQAETHGPHLVAV
jgi:Autographiviridae endonuclease VII